MRAHEPKRGAKLARLLALLAVAIGSATQAPACDARATPPPRDAVVEQTEPLLAVGDPERSAADRYVGKYGFSGGESERAAVLAAIDDVVAEMNPLARGIARQKLRDANRVPEQIEIARTADMLAIQFDDRRYEAPLDGSPVEVIGVTGDTLAYHISVRPQRVLQIFVGEKGGRENTLTVHGEQGFAVAVRVSSDSLPKPLVYRLSYRRAGH